MNSKISLVKCKNYDSQLTFQQAKYAIELLGGISSFVKPYSKVLVKPNLLMAMPPESAVCTHPEVVRAMIRILKEINCKICIGDGPSVWGNHLENVNEVYKVSGIYKVAEEEGVELIKFDTRRWKEKFPIARAFYECDFLINLPKFKTHEFTLMTGAVKNLFGLVWGTYKTELHKKYFSPVEFAKILADIYQETKPALTLVDGVLAMEGDGPGSSGKPRDCGLLLAGKDCLALDTVMASIMGVDPLDVPYIKEAAERKLGNADLKFIEILGEKLDSVSGEPFALPVVYFKPKRLSPVIASLAKLLIKYYPCVESDNCLRCAACIAACPKKAIKMENRGLKFQYSRCISCFCCQEVCPVAAIKIKKSFMAKIIGL